MFCTLGFVRLSLFAALLLLFVSGQASALDTSALQPRVRRIPPIMQTSGFLTRTTSLVGARACRSGRCRTLSMADADVAVVDSSGEAEEGQGVIPSSFNLMKALLGSGVLTLPHGVAAMSNARGTALPASIFVFALGGLSAYCFYLLGRLCHFSKARTIGELWDQEIGERTSWMVSSAILTFALGAALSYSITLGDTFSSLAKSAGITGWLASRHASILAITGVALYPLCTLRSLSALAPVSIVGVVGVVVTCLFMAARCLLPSSPYALPHGRLLGTLPEQFLPLFGTSSNVVSPSSLILVAMACCTFQAHYSAPDFYHALANNENVLRNFRNLSILGFSGVALINAAVLSLGFLTFGANSSGVILNNYSTKDLGASVCRMLMGVSVIGGFPFVIAAAKSAFFKLRTDVKRMSNENDEKELDNDENENETKIPDEDNRLVTRSFVALVTGLALLLQDAGFVVSFNGALTGSAIVYIFPCVLFLQATKRRLKERSMQLTRKLRLQRVVSRFLVVFGVITCVLAGTVTVLNQCCPRLLHPVA